MEINERVVLTKEQAMERLPDKENIHTFRQAGVLIGADWQREEVLEAINKYQFEESGAQATKMGHGMVFCDATGHVFVETK